MVEPAGCSCKIGRNIETYGLEELNADLVEKRREADASLRTLAAHCNRRLLEAALVTADVDVTDAVFGAVHGDDVVELVYDALSNDDASPDTAARVRTRLEQQGIDIETIESDWVTHPTVRSHLNECLDIDTSRSGTITVEDARNTIEWARTQCTEIISRTITRLENAGLVTIGTPSVSVTVRITCMDCGERYRPTDLLTERTCACSTTTEGG
ncbi:rod-determining factor RdfA [Natrinema sp. HArc-T2]|uniref:rod-determining factor RdfA n=1 Tax=Natrinema sp. HArc-T2 TaxID=3242701 RepID=UPI00359D9A1F